MAHEPVQHGAPASLPGSTVVDGDLRVCIEELRASVGAMQEAMGGFELELRKAGWDQTKNVCKISLSAPMLVVHERLREREIVL